MALDRSALLEVLQALKAADVDDRIRSAATAIYQALIEAELTAVIGAAPHERTETRTVQRNGTRPRILATTAGDLELRIPKLRARSFFPSLLERRRRIDQALFAVVMGAYLRGVYTRKVDDLVRALGGGTGTGKSEVSRICADPDAEVGSFRGRSLAEQTFPYVFLDATYCKARVNRRVVPQAVVIATGVAADTLIFQSFPGVGPITAATLLAEIGEDRGYYPAVGVLLAEAGLAPVTRASGRSHRVGFRYAANARLREAFMWWACNSLKSSPWARAPYDYARARKQHHHRALRGRAARLMRVLWRAWTDGIPYDQARHLGTGPTADDTTSPTQATAAA